MKPKFSLIDYLRLPKEITQFERDYLARLNRVGLAFFALHVPVLVLLAAVNHTKPLLALLLSGLVLAGPAIGYKTLGNPRHLNKVFGVTAMFMGGLLVHFGQGPMQIEMHFYFFVLLALLAVFGDPMAIVFAATTVALHHLIVYLVAPSSVFNYDAPIWAVGVHALFVVLESVAACFVARSFFDNVIGLERIVAARTAQLDARNEDLKVLRDNVGQGLLALDRQGQTIGEPSKILEKWLGECPVGTSFSSYLARVDSKTARCFEVGWDDVVTGFLPLVLTLSQLPKRVKLGERTLGLEYRPIAKGDDLEKLVVVVTDITEQLAVERMETEQRELLSALDLVIRDKNGFLEYVKDASSLVERIARGVAPLIELRRDIHTLKGNSMMFRRVSFGALCNEIEERIEDTGELSAEDRQLLSDRWDAQRRSLGMFVGEGEGVRRIEITQKRLSGLIEEVVNGTPRADVATSLRSLTFEPVDERLVRLGEHAKSVAARLDKELEVVVEAKGVRLPPETLGSFWSALVHVVRNAVDHGVEPVETRLEAGKEPRARLTLSAALEASELVVAVSDDGGGIAWDLVAKKAAARCLPHATREDLVAVLFGGGLSTRDEATEYSGRGVGISAFREACDQLGGHVSIESTKGQGTRVEARIPSSAFAQAQLRILKSLPPQTKVA